MEQYMRLHQDGSHPRGQGHGGGTFKQQQPPTAAPEGGSKRKRAESDSFSAGGVSPVPLVTDLSGIAQLWNFGKDFFAVGNKIMFIFL